MKAYKKTSEIIEYALLFHIKMKNFYEELNKQTKDQRVKMYLEFMISHEKHNEETLTEFIHNSSNEVMNSWYKFIPENLSENCLENITINPDMTVDDVVKHVVHLNNCLIEMYKGLIEESQEAEVKELFYRLWKKIEKEEKNLVRDGELLNDL